MMFFFPAFLIPSPQTSCGVYGKAGSSGCSGANLAAKTKSRHSERCTGGTGSEQALRHYLLWGQWGRQIYQPCQGQDIIAAVFWEITVSLVNCFYTAL